VAVTLIGTTGLSAGLLVPMRTVRARFSRALAALAALGMVACLLVGAVSVRSAAAATGQQFYAMQWNIAGATTHDGDPNEPNNYGSTLVTERLADFAVDWHPSVISVNEACDSQIDALRSNLEDRGLHVQAVAFSGTTSAEGPGALPDEPNPACLLSGGYFAGVALLSLVPASDPGNLWFDDETNRVVYHRTQRAGACLTLHLNRNVRVCSLHLAQNSTDAIEQAQQFVNTYRDDIAAYPYMLLGDFNATPDQLLGTMYDPSAGGFGQFYEADMDAPNRGLPTEGARKLDYAFVSSNAFDRDQLALATIDPGICRVENAFEPPWFVLYPHPCSDHRAIVASVSLLDGAGGGGGGFPPQPLPVDLPPTVNAGPDITGVEGGSVQLSGTVSDRESTPSVTWSYHTAGREVEPGVTCSFSDPHTLSTTFSCTDNGTFYVGLTADDGVNPPVTDVLKVTLSNAPPVLHLTDPQPWQVYRAGTTVALHAPFTDAGINDTHTCTVAWDDGFTESYPAADGTCDRTHTYAHAGMYTISTAVTDDDSGTDSKTVLSVVFDPNGGFVTGGGFLDSPAGSLTTTPSATTKLHIELNPRYHNGDSGPAPSGGKVKASLNGGGLRLDSSALDWLVVTPDHKTAIKGTGSVNGQDGYGFVVYGYDTDPDSLRLVVWPLSYGTIPGTGTVYDNRPAAGYDLDQADPQSLANGSLKIHQ
jgi:endonuclease/exonuclease/phosphatase family metal-dependent hydrolase